MVNLNMAVGVLGGLCREFQVGWTLCGGTGDKGQRACAVLRRGVRLSSLPLGHCVECPPEAKGSSTQKTGPVQGLSL